MWLSLVERLLWEQDAAGSNPVIRTTQRELSLVGGSLCVFLMPGWSAVACEQSKALALGERADRCQRQVKGGERVAAVCVQRSRSVGKAHTGHRNGNRNIKFPYNSPTVT